MDQYKQASKQQLRFTTPKGVLSVEQLWTLTMAELDALAVQLQEAYENSKGKSFLVKRSVKNQDIKLQFDIALDILETKVAEAAAVKEEYEIKEHNKKIDELIARKQDENLSKKSIAALEEMRR